MKYIFFYRRTVVVKTRIAVSIVTSKKIRNVDAAPIVGDRCYEYNKTFMYITIYPFSAGLSSAYAHFIPNSLPATAIARSMTSSMS